MLTYREAERASKDRGVAVRRKGWPEGMYHKHHEDGRITAGYDDEEEEVLIRDKDGKQSLDMDALDLALDREDLAAYVQGKDDWEVVKSGMTEEE